jgi:hypothetical protein
MQPHEEPARPLDLSIPEDGSIPAFLKRPFENESENGAMWNKLWSEQRKVYASDEAKAAAEPEAEAPAAKPKPVKADKPAKKATANGASKPKAEAKAKPAAKAAPAKATAKPAKGKAKAERKQDPAKLDAFGFRKESIKSKAAALYAKGKGATLADVKEALGSVQFNLLTELKEKGYEVEESEVKNTNGRMVTRYKIVSKD